MIICLACPSPFPPGRGKHPPLAISSALGACALAELLCKKLLLITGGPRNGKKNGVSLPLFIGDEYVFE